MKVEFVRLVNIATKKYLTAASYFDIFQPRTNALFGA